MPPEDFPFQLVIVLVFLLIGAVRWVLENLFAKKRPLDEDDWEDYTHEGSPTHPQPPSEGGGSFRDFFEEARREILERQNRHTPDPEDLRERLRGEQKPTPPPLPAADEKAGPTIAARPEDYIRRAGRKKELTAEEKRAAAAFQQLDKKKADARQGSQVRQLLAKPHSARDAIVLAEILGKPKSLQ
ncbi:hypothetical protein [Roseibacillus ishigakijimensis]|uniref:Uncharacterized protein n=1 Tax=Roseibacillus ishigakijimensis TaxID=454146 RepID=A0A934VM10_9BACT|nr:hypothetical protein [Roseibacillus ishigakijimensis]MBK1833777.1 hypothetical protein [Roseibacillus ishigakijimensis]